MSGANAFTATTDSTPTEQASTRPAHAGLCFGGGVPQFAAPSYCCLGGCFRANMCCQITLIGA